MASRLRRRTLCAETVLTLNDAMCDFYAKPSPEGGCGLGHAAWHTCPKWKPVDGSRGNKCEDSDRASCATWSHAGECKSNPGFMLGSCPKSCGQVYRRDLSHTSGHLCMAHRACLRYAFFAWQCERMQQQTIPAWDRGLAFAQGLPALPLRHRTQEMLSYSDKHSLRPGNAGGGGGGSAGAGASGLGGASSPHDAEMQRSTDDATRRADELSTAMPLPALTGDGAHTAGSQTFHGPSNEHHDSAHAMGLDGRAIDGTTAATAGSVATAAGAVKAVAQGARLRAAKVAGGAAGAAGTATAKPSKKCSLKAALTAKEKVAALPGAAGAAGGEAGEEADEVDASASKDATARTEMERAVARMNAADDAVEATAAAAATPVESLTSRMILMWVAVLLGCVLMLAKRFGLFGQKRRSVGGKAGGRDF